MEQSSYGCVLVTGEDHEVQTHCSTEEPRLSVTLWQRDEGEECDCCSTRNSHDRTRENDDSTKCVLVPEATRGNCSCCSHSGKAIVTVQMSWEADRCWSLRMLTLLLQSARLKMLMAWCSTLGGAHSSLGEAFFMHAEKAGEISHKQLALASEMGDLRLASQCKLYVAFSLLQKGRLKQAAKIIREQYRFAKSEATVVDQKSTMSSISCNSISTHSFLVDCIPYILLSAELIQVCGDTWVGQLGGLIISMCLSAWIRLQHLHQAKKERKDVEIQEVG